ncbi:MAG TPA: aldo/keto reductase [Reyranella sp.]|jgi:aryl-alcohol dehydrogenase-like predicted oxidoreductase|nr:aldo/keto reductase [Reyranella sp.]
MRYRPLGKTGLQVSEIGFGAWGIGGRTVEQTSYGDTDDRTSLAALDRALERGITFFDTSAAYGNGHSEELIGRAVRGKRSRAVITTKAGYEAWDQAPDFSPSAIVASTERSLARLGTDYLDLLQLHNPPLDVAAAPAVRETLARLVESGKIRAWGVSAKGPDEAMQALRACEIAVIQANFNMMDVRVVSSGLLAEVERLGVGFIARTPLCFGFLSGTIGHDSVFPAGDHRARWPRAQLANWVDGAADLMASISTAPGEAAAQAALRFCLSFPAVSTTIPGIMKPLEADQNAAASLLGPLPPQTVEAILEINRNRRFFVSA